MGIDPVHLNLRACAMDWRTQFARFFFFFFFFGGGGGGGGGEVLSAGLQAERIAVLLVVVKI